MSGLLPEVRADRNGKLVTRHVKPATGGTGMLQDIAMPSLPQAKVSKVDLYDLAQRVFMMQDPDYPTAFYPAKAEPYTDDELGDTVEYLDGYPQDQLWEIIDLSLNSVQQFREISAMLHAQERPSFVRTYLTIRPSLHCDKEDRISIARFIDNMMEERERHDLSDSGVIGLAKVTEAILATADYVDHDKYVEWKSHAYDAGETPVLDTKLVDFILENETRVDRIITTGNTRDNFSLDVLEEIINHSNQSLAEGTL